MHKEIRSPDAISLFLCSLNCLEEGVQDSALTSSTLRTTRSSFSGTYGFNFLVKQCDADSTYFLCISDLLQCTLVPLFLIKTTTHGC